MDEQEKDDRPVRAQLPPFIWRVMLVVAALWVLIAWFLFARGGYSSVTLSMVTVFTIIIVGVTTSLSRTWRHHPEGHPGKPPHGSLKNWLASDFEICGGRVKARDALAGILIPFGAVILGAIMIGIAFDLS
jgi:hypothetical protein